MKEKRILEVLGQVNENYMEEAFPETKNRKKYSFGRWVAAAACLVAVIIGIQRMLPENTGPVKSEIPLETRTMQEKIVKSQDYGAVVLSTKSSGEILALAEGAGIPLEKVSELTCYEDLRYTYLFYEDGTTAGIIANYLEEDTINPEELWKPKTLSEEEALVLARSALLKYCESYSESTANRFEEQAEYYGEEFYPVWQITFTEKNTSGIIRNRISVNIDRYGNVSEVLFGLRSSISDGELAQTEYIPEEEAKILAAAYLLDAGYEISPEQFSVTAQMAENQGKVTWNLKYEEIESTGKFVRRYYVLLDAVSGERISVDIGR